MKQTRRPDDDFPLLGMHFRIRNPRRVLLLNPFQLPLAVGLFTLALVFTIWPEALEHSPISFERRGIIHHVWHYTLLAGAGLTLWGMLSSGKRRMTTELVGVILLIGALAINLVAIISAGGDFGIAAPGFAVTNRVALIIGFSIRAYILFSQPVIDLTTRTSDNKSRG